MNLADLVTYLDTELRIAEIPDYANAYNGLQLENASGKVSKVVAAVDATLPVIGKAVSLGADLLIVHHGMFWNTAQPWTGPVFRKMKLAIDAGLAVYSCHLPLDFHPVLGNDAGVARALGFESCGTLRPRAPTTARRSRRKSAAMSW
jgi:putative NIF3 family GTP cyclohydrolase 1 type 2